VGHALRTSTSLGYVDKALQYCHDVISGKIPACKWVKLACERQLSDLTRASDNDPTFPYLFDIAKGERVCFFLEQLPHIEGPLTGQKLRLEPWQCLILTTVFGWVHRYDDKPKGIKAGKRRFRRTYVEVPRGNGKSSMSAGVLLYMLGLDGEGGAQIYSVATSVEQAQAVYRPAENMLKQLPDLQKRFGISISAHRLVVEKTASFARALPYKPGVLDGLNVHLAVVDELHAHKVRTVYEVIESGLGKRDQSLLWTITTAGFDRSGICFEKHTYLKSILENKTHDESFFGVIYTVDDTDDWTEESSWVKANPNWNVSVSPVFVGSQATQAMTLAAKQPEFKTKHLCVWVNADSAWMDMRRWLACADTHLNIEEFASDECIVGLDLASRLDLAACIKLYRRHNEDDGAWHYYAFGVYWLPEAAVETSNNSQYPGWVSNNYLQASPGETNDFDLIEDHLKTFAGSTNLKEVAHDPYQAHQLVTHLQAELGEEAVIQIAPHVKHFSPAMKELEALVNEGRFHFDGDPILSWGISNVVCHRDAKDNIYPRKQQLENKIDPVIALLMALYRWTAFEDEPPPSISFM
jgi:phage terminase large subunit-like protein